jgi:hypothetical protein
MRQFKDLRAIALVTGFVRVAFGCATGKSYLAKRKVGNMRHAIVLVFILLSFFVPTLPAEEPEPERAPFILFLPIGYDLSRLEEQTIHSAIGGIGFMSGEQNQPFDQVKNRFLGMALYMPYIFTEIPNPDMPKVYHGIRSIFDGRLRRHQILAILSANSDAPVYGGLNTFRFASGWGYEIIRNAHVSLILGAVAGVSDFGVGSPVLPLPLVRFAVDTTWFTSSFDFITGPNLSFTIAPKERIRFSADMEMETFRSIADLNCEFTLWYRLFSPNHKMGDFAGIGVGFKNELTSFDLSRDFSQEKFELQKSSVLATLDLSLLTIQAGWVIDSNYLLDDKKAGSPGNGFFLSVQGMIPLVNRAMKNTSRGE